MTDHKPLPVSGYKPQSQETIDLVNEGKALEERVLRYIEKLRNIPGNELRFSALGLTNIQQGFMWTFRSVFKPDRTKLPEDPA